LKEGRLDSVNLKSFIHHSAIPFGNLAFFAKHFCPYVFIQEACKENSILEIGFGEGYGLSYLSHWAGRCAGIDLRLERCLQTRKKYGLHNLLVMNGEDLGFQERVFDIIYCFQVIEHISEERVVKFLEEIKRRLNKKGVFICSTLNLEKNIKGHPERYEKFPEHQKEYRLSELGALLKKVFSGVQIYGLFPTPRHRFYLTLKKSGFLKYNFFNHNPIKAFYDNISTSDFLISKSNLEKAIDFIAVCSAA
jgi:2-polyprenyl-3-methyl-5-hydroxy-6-metoxy-1,4-benzoquinol methylase